MKLPLLYRPLMLILFVFAYCIAVAQDKATSDFLDSLKTPPPLLHDTVAATVDSATETVGAVADDEKEMPLDTAIRSNIREINVDSLKLIKNDKGFYYKQWLDSLLRAEEGKVKIVKKPKQIDMPDFSLFFNIFQVILWVLAGGVLVFVLYKLFLSNTGLFIRNRKNIDAIVNIEEEEVQAGRYDGLIKKAETEGNFRLAVRYLYLQSLYNLSERGYIKLATDKTNYQYITELRSGPAGAANLFSVLTNKYDYIWYGEYAVTNHQYESLREEFAAFNKKIQSD